MCTPATGIPSATELPDLNLCFSGKTACCFTGHRPAGLPDPAKGAFLVLRARLMEAVQAAAAAGVTHFLAGGARGFDMLAEEAVLYLRDTCGMPLTLTLALPSPRQAEGWPTADRERYESILDRADAIRYFGETNAAHSMHLRNRYLVDNADCCICYLRRAAGGTLYTVNYAIERGICLYNLALPIG